MNRAYRPAMIVLAVGLLPLAISLFAGAIDSQTSWALVLPAIALPVALLLAVRASMGREIAPAALLGGALLAPLIAIVGESLVPAYAYVFFSRFRRRRPPAL